MASANGNGLVGLVLVSHSASIAGGLAELVGQVAGPDVTIVTAGGGPDDSLGTDGGRVLEALREAGSEAGTVVLVDLGSSLLSVRAALAELSEEEVRRIVLADAPLVEGAIAAGVIASTGAGLADVAGAAEEARSVRKL
ncbi:MAG: dihydroxyacetone kinase phosphoryl donor subunit DhaM [Gaiellaceae bacterium]